MTETGTNWYIDSRQVTEESECINMSNENLDLKRLAKIYHNISEMTRKELSVSTWKEGKAAATEAAGRIMAALILTDNTRYYEN